MRNMYNALWLMLGVTVMSVLLWAILTVFARPMIASERVTLKDNGMLRPGYIQTPVAPQQPSTVMTGRITSYRSPSERIYLKTYETSSYKVTTGRVGSHHIHVKEYKKPTLKKD